MNTSDAAYHTVHDYGGGSESLGPRVGISPAVLRNKVNTRTPREEKRHHLTFEEAQRIAALTGDYRMLQAWAHAEGFLLVKAPVSAAESSDKAVLEQVVEVAVANGEFMRTINVALADGRVDSKEVEAIREAERALQTAASSVTVRMQGMSE